MTPYSKCSKEMKDNIYSEYMSGVPQCNLMKKYNISARCIAHIFNKDFKIDPLFRKRKNRYTILHEDFFEVIDTPLKAYLLGLMAADGCATEANYICLDLKVSDSELVFLFADSIGIDSHMVKQKIRSSGFNNGLPTVRVNFSSRKIKDDLQKYHIIAGGQLDSLPDIQFIDDFIHGYFDGDGCVHKNINRSGGLINIICSVRFANALIEHYKFGSISNSKTESMVYWRVFHRKDLTILYDKWYMNINGLNRKKEKIELILNSYERKEYIK